MKRLMATSSVLRRGNHTAPRVRRLLGGVAFALALSVTSAHRAEAADAVDAKKIFNQRCTGCHTFGKGVKVGPDLKGVTQRRPREWLLKFIRSSQKVIGSGDVTAQGLFQQFKQQRMPDWTSLSEAQVGAVLDWFAVDGPEQKEPDERSAELATPAEIEWARGLFQGTTRLAGGGAACSTCHSVKDRGETSGGSLGPDLTDAYLKYQDKAMTLFLKKPCFPRSPESSQDAFLTPQESFGIKAYLRQAAVPEAK